jgi:hypothetical protein
MTEHGHDHGAAVAEAHETHTEDAHAGAHASAPDYRFERQELQLLEEEDRDAGRHIGLLLAAVFCIGLGLVAGVTAWTIRHHNVGHDPQVIPGAGDAEHH